MERKVAKKLREKSGLTQNQLAEKLGISAVYVRKIEHGDRRPSNNVAEKYVQQFGLPANKIFPDIYAGLIDTKAIKSAEPVH